MIGSQYYPPVVRLYTKLVLACLAGSVLPVAQACARQKLAVADRSAVPTSSGFRTTPAPRQTGKGPPTGKMRGITTQFECGGDGCRPHAKRRLRSYVGSRCVNPGRNPALTGRYRHNDQSAPRLGGEPVAAPCFAGQACRHECGCPTLLSFLAQSPNSQPRR